MKTQFHLTAALTTVLLLATAAVWATVQLSQFQDAGLDNRRFVVNVLFVTSRVRSYMDCASHCTSYHGCVTFTYSGQGSSGPGSCRGHSTNMTSENAHEVDYGAKTYLTFDPCATGNHVVIDDYRRDVNYPEFEGLCDSDSLVPGWHRFFINGSSASMPTSCPPIYRCGTDAPMWLDLQNATLPPVRQEVQARSCASWWVDCCYSGWETPVTVRNCGGFYVYNLQKPALCYLSYCAEV